MKTTYAFLTVVFVFPIVGMSAQNVVINPSAPQHTVQPTASGAGVVLPTTSADVSRLANIRYVTPTWNWSQSPPDDLSSPGSKTMHLAPCPLGLDTAASTHHYTYKVYISGTATPEAVAVTGGSCTPGSSGGTIQVTTAHAHAAGYTVGSASGGIQEAWNDAWVNDQAGSPYASSQVAPYVKLMSNTVYSVYASIYLRSRGGVLDGKGAIIQCSTRDRCIYVGTTQGVPYVAHHKLYGLNMTSTTNVDGAQVSSVSVSSGTYTVTTAATHPFVAGDSVSCEFYSQTLQQRWVAQVLASGLTATQFQVQIGRGTTSADANTFGWCNILNAAIEDNSEHVIIQDLNIFTSGPSGWYYFSYGVVNDNDQQLQIDHAGNRSTIVIENSANWPIGAFIYQRTDGNNAGITYIHGAEIANVNCFTGGGNGMVITDSVCEGFPVYGGRYFGGLQPITIENVYQESPGSTTNPLYGYAAQTGVLVGGGIGNRILGMFPISGLEPRFAAGGGVGALRNYFVVPRSSTTGYGIPLFIGSAQPSSGSASIPLVWPSIDLQTATGRGLGTLTWDILATTGTATPPYGTGSFAIATNVSGSCGTNGMCHYTDTQAGTTTYTVQTPQFFPSFWFWPVGLVINGNSPLFVDQAAVEPSAVASVGTSAVSIIAEQCRSFGASYWRTPIWISCLHSDTANGSGSIATVLQQADGAGNGPVTSSKGRLNFGRPVTAPNDVITLVDSNFAKTVATSGERPTSDAGDMAIGLDQGGGLAERAATSISEYINAVPKDSNFLERLTAEGKTFKVPIATPPATLVLSTAPIAPNACRTQGVPMMGLRTTSVVKWSFASTPIGVTGYGTGALQISTFSALNTANVVVCNITGLPVTPGAITVNIREEL